jgi:hypothetical protein
MKNLYHATAAEEVKERVERRRPDSEQQWGKMSPAQAMEHCSVAMEWAVGDTRPPRMFLERILGSTVKSKALGDERPMGRNAPTAKNLAVADERNLGVERKRLCADEFVQLNVQRTPHRLRVTRQRPTEDQSC